MAATLSELAQQNPNVRSQIETWQRERVDKGQSPSDWEAFRQHAMAIGAPDPGQEAPDEFMQSASSAQSSAASSSSSGQSPAQAQTPVQPQAQTQVAPQAQAPVQPQWQAPSQPQTPQLSQAEQDAIRIRKEYEADKDTPTDRWLKARGMTKAQLDEALKLAASADPNRSY